jgi:adenine/guanine phosphoribosyltransferase-like PRPP-binding protein
VKTPEIHSAPTGTIAHYFSHTHPEWIFGIPEGGISLAQRVASYFPDARLIRTKKLAETIPYAQQVLDWKNPQTFPVFSHKDQIPRIVAWETPPAGASILVIDNVCESGLTAEDVLGELRRKAYRLVGFAVHEERRAGALEGVAKQYTIPVFAAVKGA